MGMERMTDDVCFEEVKLQVCEESFQQWVSQVQALDYSLPILLSDLLRRKASVGAGLGLDRDRCSGSRLSSTPDKNSL